MRNHRTVLFAVAVLLAFCSSSFAQCSSATVRGTWAYQALGTVMMSVPGSAAPMAVPFAGLGIMKIDYQGRYTVQATMSAGGQVQDVADSGSMQVNSDCTATDTYTYGPALGTDRLIILDNGNEMRSMPTQAPIGPMAGIAYYRRLAWGDAQCTTDMVRGAYAGWRQGTVMMPVSGQSQPVSLPFSALVTFTVQPGGNGTAASTASMGGSIVNFEFSKASIQVNPDCTAILNWSAGSKQFPGQTFTGTLKYIVLNYGNELMGLDTSSSGGASIVIENDKRVSMMPLASGQ